MKNLTPEELAAWICDAARERVHNLAAGLDAWGRGVDPAMPVY